MKQRIIAAVFAAATMGTALPAQAITFNFFWTSDPAANPDLLVSPDPMINVTGTMDVNVTPGARFSQTDISNVNLLLSGPNITDITFTDWNRAAGFVASDGLSASFADLSRSNPFARIRGGGLPTRFFGCGIASCQELGEAREIEVSAGPTFTPIYFDYTSSAAAYASMQMTAIQTSAPVPLPAGLPLLLAGLGALGLMRRACKPQSYVFANKF